ncbi:histidine kinase [Actinoplanes sp. SE50]|uniref:sensor histidine kinase n=1 Tax=unclassified Actinoplanes TaxID=2626549 RepID=UPI00023ED3FD|nr:MULTISPECIES: ATP-binding protein [unclassified Actinoplanes]AEV83369.1 multi-sensor signal transduction histidine kinase [Actinoplanes sp. SE50/110]ATO81762.1 histidine kinase [Actinoplanes sp. SE50]SLL99170.1 histidine kinase [Actinoplanes sp. SE50/110]
MTVQGVPDSDAFLGALLESLTVGVVACDADGRVVLVNRTIREVRGFPLDGPVPADYVASTERVLATPGRPPMTWERTPLMRALRGEHIVAEDVLIQCPDQPVRVFACSAQPIRDAGGGVLGAVAIGHEVTALHRAERFRDCHLAVEQALKRATTVRAAAPEVLRAVVETLGWPCAELFVIDEAACGGLRAVGHWDTGCAAPDDDFFGHVPRRGEGITGRVWETGRAIWVSDISAHRDLRTSYERERVGICIRRGIRTVLAVPVHDGDTLLGVLTCYAGARERHEELLTVLMDGVAAQIGVFVALRRAEELARQLARAQNDFVDLIGHEMRTPLTSITANATILAEEAAGLDHDGRQMARTIARNAAVLQRIAESLLDLAGLDGGHLTVAKRPVDLAALVGDAVAAAHAPISADLPGELPVPGDPDRLRQALDDLLANAVKYSPPGAPIRVTLCGDETSAELCIADTGIGTREDERDRVFDRFFRGSNVRHQGTHGSGLGLSLARSIIHLHGGTIQLAANDPSGTVVCVRLPR